jgi:hypothetical protein
MAALRYQRLATAPVRTVHDLGIMALGLLVATWPLLILYFLIRAVF